MRRELQAEKALRKRNDTALRAEMAAAESVAAEVLSDAINGTAEKAETRLLREQTVAAKKDSTAARKAAVAAEEVAEEATAVREAESLKRVAAQRELQRLRSEQEQMMEEAARAASVEDGVRLQALRQQATSARAESAAVRAASEAEMAAVRAAAAAEMNQAAEQVRQADAQVRSEQSRRGIAEGKQATATAMKERDINIARAEVARLREALAEAEEQATGKRRPAAQETARLVGCRLWDADDAPLSARDQTFAVALVEETNSSFQGASTAIALVLGWLFGEEALGMGKYLLSPNTFSRAVEVMGTLNDDAVRKVNAADTGPWGAVADGANKGRTADLLAYNKADAAGQPQSAAMGVHDLYSDQRTVNNITTAIRAIVHAGLPASTMVSFLTDGTEHALQEARGVCERMANTAEGKPRPAWSVGNEPKPDVCSIHGLALEENGGIKAAFPGEYHTHGALLLWEIVASPEGSRPDEYRAIWTKDLRHVDQGLLPLPEHIFNIYLARLTKSTTSKWEVSAMASRQILMLLEPPEGRVAGSRSMLEIFLHKCRQMFCGTLDDDKVLTLTLTPSPSPSPSPSPRPHPRPHPHPKPQP